MLRSRRPLTALSGPECPSRLISLPTRPLLQLQGRERLLLRTHGAGVVQHNSMAQEAAAAAVANNYNSATVAPRAADLFRTRVHEGTGTSAEDPYVRTLPNQESREPASSVAQAYILREATVDECNALHQTWGSMQYWLGDRFPRLPLYLKQLQVPDVPSLSPAADNLLLKFEAVIIPQLVSDETDKVKLVTIWKEMVKKADEIVKKHIFHRENFETTLSHICEEALQKMRTLSLSGAEGPLAIEALRRRTVLERNKYIQENFIDVVSNGSYLGFGDAVWRVFFQAVEANKNELLGENTLEAVRFAWEAIMQEDVVRLPDVTAPVALFLTLVCIDESGRLVSDELKELSLTLDDGIKRNSSKWQQGVSLNLLNPVVKRRFVAKTLSVMLQVESSNALSKILREYGLHDLSREASLCEAMNNNEKLLEDDIADAVSRFESKSEVKTLLSSLMGGTDVAVRETIAKILGITSFTSVNWDAVMQSVDWSSNWRQLGIALLRDQMVLVAVHKHIKNAIGAKGVSKHLFTEAYAEELQDIIHIREEREQSKKLKIERIVQELSSYQKVDQTCDILRQLGVDMSELDKEALSLQEKNLIKRPHLNKEVMSCVLEAVSNRHSNWVKAGVIQTEVRNPLEILKVLMHIFIRLTYVPQAGAALMAQRLRRRIGPVGIESYQHNVPTEVGFVEQYDNLQYKRYDWQGWYQRMVDIHNRNVSLRCRINDLKRLDANGKPFVDMQTERRLRILAQERVGMGVLKLDSDKYEDQSDNMTYGTVKLSELLADARKAQLGEEYWPSVELKVRRPSGQSKAHYSLMDYDRVERRSSELYEKYRDAKKRSLFVTPMDMWLEVKGMQVRKAVDSTDSEGYTVDALQDMMNSEDGEKR
ncbi:uncharacterized protein TM35_000052420 [Trypanosoma theileri]|uniref:Uncharacterized protein n=1 Tax=Trypanosoma theileri TaxID=67003 RepID=A0A1X0P3Z7_9TRYP|nr:uncharacterized protein TM35_000052420 [Trypanosoma theileri]ORC91646.1 hypothetical protein TM35_000052420 [Trypanosoma theileri]